uniref:Uncharacterized protein n=1 Tax=Arundo donax TaxID=35708 RepID=A0A0A8Y577_ARUDO
MARKINFGLSVLINADEVYLIETVGLVILRCLLDNLVGC